MARVGQKGIELLEGYSRAQALACARLVATAIAHVATHGQGSWGLTTPGRGPFARLTSGWTESVVLSSGKVGVLLLGTDPVPGALRRKRAYGTAPNCFLYRIDPAKVATLLPQIEVRFRAALEIAARMPLMRSVATSHQQWLADAFWRASGKPGNAPAPVGLPTGAARPPAGDKLSPTCIYTILQSAKTDEIVRRGGAGVFEEGRPWRKGQTMLAEANAVGKELPILFAAAENILGVTHMGYIRAIQIKGKGTRVRVAGVRELAARQPLPRLTVASTGKRLPATHRRPYVLVNTPAFALAPKWAEPKVDVPSGDAGKDSERAEAVEEQLRHDAEIAPTERQALTLARRGQGRFRKAVKEVEPVCRLTSEEEDSLLVASHIKPWAVCSNEERLSRYNGLMLAPHVDHLFDRGWISFADDGSLLVSPSLPPKVLERWGLSRPARPKPFRPEQAAFLAHHRARHGFR